MSVNSLNSIVNSNRVGVYPDGSPVVFDPNKVKQISKSDVVIPRYYTPLAQLFNQAGIYPGENSVELDCTVPRYITPLSQLLNKIGVYPDGTPVVFNPEKAINYMA